MQFGRKFMKIREEIFSSWLIDKFEAHVAKHPKKVMLIFEDCVYTYEFMDQQANRVANMMRQLGLKLDDTVAMMVNNEPAFIWTLLGELFVLTSCERWCGGGPYVGQQQQHFHSNKG